VFASLLSPPFWKPSLPANSSPQHQQHLYTNPQQKQTQEERELLLLLLPWMPLFSASSSSDDDDDDDNNFVCIVVWEFLVHFHAFSLLHIIILLNPSSFAIFFPWRPILHPHHLHPIFACKSSLHLHNKTTTGCKVGCVHSLRDHKFCMECLFFFIFSYLVWERGMMMMLPRSCCCCCWRWSVCVCGVDLSPLVDNIISDFLKKKHAQSCASSIGAFK